jgi:multiple sugar transport system permease protein
MKKTPASMKKSQKSAKHQIRTKVLLQHLLLITVGLSFLLPFYWLLATSLKTDSQVFQNPPVWVPHPMMWHNYPRALTYIPFLRYTINTLVIAGLSVFGTVFSCALAAYGFSRIKWPGRDFLFIVLLSTMMLPAQVTMIPVFAIFKNLGWVGSIKPLVVPAFFGNAFFIFMLRQFYRSIPKELSESAKLDGCSELGIFWNIILPLSRPAIAMVALFTFIGSWNDFMGPLIYLNDDLKYTLSVGLQQFLSQHGSEWSLLMAASTVMTIPIIILFFLTQKTFIEGITFTGIKG